MEQLITGAVADPHALLGAHPDGERTVLRTLRRGATEVLAVVDGDRHPMDPRHDEGIFEVTVPGDGAATTGSRWTGRRTTTRTGIRRRWASWTCT